MATDEKTFPSECFERLWPFGPRRGRYFIIATYKAFSYKRSLGTPGVKKPLIFGLLLASGAAVHGQSAVDGFDPNANGLVWPVVVQADGKILIGGNFTTLSPNGGAVVTRNLVEDV
jgi:hypothetical protein